MAEKSEVIQQYIQEARQMLVVADHNIGNGFYRTAVNRSYYALFYAATALLFSIGETRGKHYGVMAAFRQYFIKNGLWDSEFSGMYGRLMDHREQSDYRIFAILTPEDAQKDLADAHRFVTNAENWLAKDGWL